MPNNVFSTALARNPYPFDSRSSRVRSHWLRAGIAKPLIVALCLIGVPGCSTWSVGPDFERPDMQNMPEKWDAGDPQHPLVGNVSLDTWWQSFNDPALNQLVTRARLSSPTIEAALLKIVQYRAQYAIAIGSFFPQTQELTGTYSSEHPSRRSADAPTGRALAARHHPATESGLSGDVGNRHLGQIPAQRRSRQSRPARRPCGL